MNIDEIRAEIPKAFGRWCTVSKIWLETNDVDTRDFELEDYCKIAARTLVDWAYEAGTSESGKKLYEKGYEAGKSEAIVVPDNAAIAKADYEGYERGYNDAAKDPKAWYILDRNNDPVHIDDPIYEIGEELKDHVIGFRLWNDEPQIIIDDEERALFQHEFEKVTPDTREKIKDELAGLLEDAAQTYCDDWEEESLKLAEQFISRIEALGE